MPDKPLLILPRSAPLPRVKQQRAMKSYLRLPGRGDQGELRRTGRSGRRGRRISEGNDHAQTFRAGD